MPSLFSRLFGAPARETKYSRAAKMLAMHSLGLPHWTSRNSSSLTREGYERNAVCHRCVRMVAEAAGSIPWLIYSGREEIVDHPLMALIERPNPVDTGVSFIEAICANLLLYGNAYIESVLLDGELRELYALRPDRISIEPGRNGWPAAFIYRAMGHETRYDMRGEGIEPILHIKFFNPLDDYYGFPPLAAAQVALDTHNAASFWNKALLDNSARPSGALVYAGPDGAHLTDEQFTRLKEELEENFSGSANAGRPLLLEGGLDWKALSLSPKDMDFTESKAGAAREIALAFGVPPLLLGLPGDNTFANYSEANRAFWRQTVLPLVSRVQKSFQAWLAPGFEPFRFDYNADRLEALADERASEWARVGKAGFLTLDEQREALGYGPTPKDAVFLKRGGGELELRYSPDQPRAPAGSSDGGQWTSGGGFSGGGSGGSRDDARRPDMVGRVQTALNANPRVVSDIDASITPAQARGGGRPPNLPSARRDPSLRRDGLNAAREAAEEAFNRVRLIDPRWRNPQWIYDPEREEVDSEIEFWKREEQRAIAREGFVRGAQRGRPFGLPSQEEYIAFSARIRKGLKEAGLDDAEIILKGSAVTGERYTTGEPFDADSDFDVGVITPRGIRLAERFGIELRGRGGRTRPLKYSELKQFGLAKLIEDLSRVYGREVSLMFYRSADDAISRPGPYMIAP